MTLTAISTFPSHRDATADTLLTLGQLLIDRGYARLNSLYFRRIHGVSHRTVTLTLPGHDAVLHLVDTGSTLSCHCDYTDGHSEVVTTGSGSAASVFAAIEGYFGLGAATRAA